MALSSELADNFRTNVGQYYDGCSAARQNVRVLIESDGLRIEPDYAAGETWRMSDVRMVERLSSASWFTLANRQRGGARLRLPPRMYDRLLEAFGAPEAPGVYDQIRPYLLPVAAFLAWIFCVICILAPVLARQVADSLSPAALAEQGRVRMETYVAQRGRSRSSGRFCADPEGQKALARLVAVIAGLPSQSFKPHVTVVRNREVNAVSFGGGYAVLNSGLIDAARTETEVIGVIAHEMGHGQGRHSIRRSIEALTALRFMSYALHSSAGTFGHELTGLPSRSPIERQAMEREADRFAILQLRQAEMDPGRLGGLMELMEAEGGGEMGFFDAHPSYAERAALFRAASRPNLAVLNADEWRALKGICRSTTKTAPAFLQGPGYR